MPDRPRRPPFRRPDPTAVRFALVGAANSVVGLGTIFGAKALLGLGDFPANALGYAVGLACSFVLNARFTFRFDGAMGPAFAKFVGAFLIAYAANWLSVLALLELAHANAYLAHALAMCVYTIVFYVASRAYVFRAA